MIMRMFGNGFVSLPKKLPSAGLLSKCLRCAGLGWNEDLETQSRLPAWVVRSQLLELSLAATQSLQCQEDGIMSQSWH